MIGKLVVHAATREQAIVRMRRALDEMVLEGISTNVALHRWIFEQQPFVNGRYDTHFLERTLDPDAIRAKLHA
jgi:acetyl-CoA carboxylase biotin carboxylase subunit